MTDADIGTPTAATATLTPDIFGDYVLRLTVSDGQDSTMDETVVRVDNHMPVADAGRPQTAETGTVVSLDGSGSFDPDGQLLTYQWSLLTVPTGSSLTSADLMGSTTPNPSFTPDVDGTYVVQLVVDDGVASSLPSEVPVVASQSNVAPNARAGGQATARGR